MVWQWWALGVWVAMGAPETGSAEPDSAAASHAGSYKQLPLYQVLSARNLTESTKPTSAAAYKRLPLYPVGSAHNNTGSSKPDSAAAYKRLPLDPVLSALNRTGSANHSGHNASVTKVGQERDWAGRLMFPVGEMPPPPSSGAAGPREGRWALLGGALAHWALSRLGRDGRHPVLSARDPVPQPRPRDPGQTPTARSSPDVPRRDPDGLHQAAAERWGQSGGVRLEGRREEAGRRPLSSGTPARTNGSRARLGWALAVLCRLRREGRG